MSVSSAKRRASPPPIEDEAQARKKPKLEPTGDPAAVSDSASTTKDNPVDIASSVEQNKKNDANTVRSKKTAVGKLSKKGKPPVATLFTPWKTDIKPPPPNGAWGKKPFPGPEGPKAHPKSPSARTSNAATTPELWEDRKYRFKPGRYHKHFGLVEEESQDVSDDDDDTPMLDQKDNLVIKLMDMRPISQNNPEPRRMPVIYQYENGIPKDWNNEQTLKALNDRRREAIWRITQDAPWSDMERHYLADLCSEFPDASIMELAERFNYRFMGDFKVDTAFSFDHLHDGRTLESIRHEYLQFKPLYDRGEVPDPKRQEMDKTGIKKNQKTDGGLRDQRIKAIFGSKRCREPEENPVAVKKPRRTAKKSQNLIVDSDDELDYEEHTALHNELLDLAGFNNPSQEHEPSTPKTPREPEPRRPSIELPTNSEELLDLAGQLQQDEPRPTMSRHQRKQSLGQAAHEDETAVSSHIHETQEEQDIIPDAKTEAGFKENIAPKDTVAVVDKTLEESSMHTQVHESKVEETHILDAKLEADADADADIEATITVVEETRDEEGNTHTYIHGIQVEQKTILDAETEADIKENIAPEDTVIGAEGSTTATKPTLPSIASVLQQLDDDDDDEEEML